MKIRKIHDYLWEVPREGKMRVPARIYATEDMIGAIRDDQAPLQAANVACLPGIVKYSLAMPDIHWGYGRGWVRHQLRRQADGVKIKQVRDSTEFENIGEHTFSTCANRCWLNRRIAG